VWQDAVPGLEDGAEDLPTVSTSVIGFGVDDDTPAISPG
jgi:hypothetical protein